MKNLMFTCLLYILIHSGSYAQSLGENGMVASANALASQIGVDVLKNGGNAVDASIATAFALAVTVPADGNIGGGGFMVYMNQNGEATTIDFREKGPLSASPSMFLDRNGKLLEGSNHRGAKSIGVPGTVAGLYLAHKKYGKLPWSELVQPAVRLAKEGFSMTWEIYLESRNEIRRDSTNLFLKKYFSNSTGQIVKPGELWKQPALAQTLEIIRDKGRDGFYKGIVANEIEAFMKKNGGIITEKDLEKYTAVERKAIKGTFKGYDVYSMPPPSSGGVALIEMLNMIEHANIDSIEFNSAHYVHLLTEVMRRTFADRAEHLGDPEFNLNMPLDKLTSKEFAQIRFKNIDMNNASVSDSSKFAHPYGGNNTTHFSVVDQHGNAVALTYTLEQGYGARIGSDKLGFFFNNEMGDFNPMPGVTTSEGQIGTDPNLIAPEKRMLSSMTPTIIAKNGKPYLIIGASGGRTIINTVFQTILNYLVFDMEVDKAIETMKIHHQWLPNVILYEKHLMSPDTKKQLEEMGHTLRPVYNIGSIMGISYNEDIKIYIGYSDSNSLDGGAVGY